MIKFKVFPRRTVWGRRWYWHLIAKNGEIIAPSQGYRRRLDCLNAVQLVASTDGSTPVDIIEK